MRRHEKAAYPITRRGGVAVKAAYSSIHSHSYCPTSNHYCMTQMLPSTSDLKLASAVLQFLLTLKLDLLNHTLARHIQLPHARQTRVPHKTHPSTPHELSSAMARTKLSVLTDPSYVPSRCRDSPCGHALHPAVSNYRDSQCPYCHMIYAMSDLRKAQDAIKARGGVYEWYEKCEWEHECLKWKRATNGGSRKSRVVPATDIHGNDSSHLSAKARLHNVLIELGCISVEEKA